MLSGVNLLSVHSDSAEASTSHRASGHFTDCLTWPRIREFIRHRAAARSCHHQPILALILSISHQVSNTLSEMSNDTSQYSIERGNGRMDKDVTLLPQ